VDLKGCRFRNREQQKLVTSLFCKWIFYGNRAGRNKFDSALARVVTLIFEFPPRLFATVVTSTFRTPRRHETMKNRPTTTSRIEMSPPRGDTNWTKTITIQFLMDTVDGNDAINYRLCRPKIRGAKDRKDGDPRARLVLAHRAFSICAQSRRLHLRRHGSLPISPINWKLSCRFARRTLPHGGVVTHCSTLIRPATLLCY
jgi:hypothetical protein